MPAQIPNAELSTISSGTFEWTIISWHIIYPENATVMSLARVERTSLSEKKTVASVFLNAPENWGKRFWNCIIHITLLHINNVIYLNLSFNFYKYFGFFPSKDYILKMIKEFHLWNLLCLSGLYLKRKKLNWKSFMKIFVAWFKFRSVWLPHNPSGCYLLFGNE